MLFVVLHVAAERASVHFRFRRVRATVKEIEIAAFVRLGHVLAVQPTISAFEPWCGLLPRLTAPV